VLLVKPPAAPTHRERIASARSDWLTALRAVLTLKHQGFPTEGGGAE
jgi:hypothetical protein